MAQQPIKLSEFYASFLLGVQGAGITIVNDMQPRPAAPSRPAAPPPLPKSAWATIEERAKARAKETSCTREQAVADVCTADPDLYRRYQIEMYA